MPDMMNLPQPSHTMLLRQGKESTGRNGGDGFPEYLKHANVLGDQTGQLKLTASNSLFHAVLKGRLRGTRYLLDRTANVNGRNDYGYSVLTAALHVDDDRRRDKLFRLLLERGADPFFRDTTYDRNVLHWACLLGRTQQVKTLLRDVGGDMNLGAKDKDSNSALHHAVMAGHLPIVILLVTAHRKFGVTVDIADKMGLTPYLHAKRLGYRDVADHLLTEGQASQGHGDIMFRTPREWSQIGKFERQKAIEIHTQEAINVAKIKGKITHVRHLEGSLNSPRMAVPNIVLPSYSPAHNPGVKLAHRHTDRLSRSLPSLEEPLPRLDLRPSSANGQEEARPDVAGQDGDTSTRTDNPQPPKEAFVEGGGHTQGEQPHDTHRGPALRTGVTSTSPTGVAAPGASALTSRGSMATLTLMEMNDKGRHARHYRQSQFDESKAAEYKHMLGNLNSIMDLLSQQQCKSFRQSVKCHQPETPKKRKSKSKVSSLAVIFGRDKSGRRSHKKRSPKPSARRAAAGARKENAPAATAEPKKTKASPAQNKKVMPLLKVNGNVM